MSNGESRYDEYLSSYDLTEDSSIKGSRYINATVPSPEMTISFINNTRMIFTQCQKKQYFGFIWPAIANMEEYRCLLCPEITKNFNAIVDHNIIYHDDEILKFASWCDQGGLQDTFNGDQKLTVFVFNDTSYNTMPSDDRQVMNLISSRSQYKDYIDTFTITTEKNTNSWSDGAVEEPVNSRSLFIKKKRRTFTGAGGTSGTEGVYVNGAMIDTSYQTSNGIIHRLVRPLLPVSSKNIYEWIHAPEFNIPTTKFIILADKLRQNHLKALDKLSEENGRITLFLPSESAFNKIPQSKFQALTGRVLYDSLTQKLQQESLYYFDAISPLSRSSGAPMTIFIPSDQAISKIPASKRDSLSGKLLADYFKMHYLPNDAVFTSYLEHQNSFQTAETRTRAVFMIQDDRVLVRSGGVTAQIIRGNITVENGVIHIIDRMLGYVYFTAREQINSDCQELLTCRFKQLIDRANPNIASAVSRTGVNMFVPIDEAFQRVLTYRGIDFQTNATLADFILRLCILEGGDIEVSRLNGNYDVRQRRRSQYNNLNLVIFNDRNDTWVNGGHVRARIIRPDVDTTNNGRLQYIDAVPGVPWNDIPTLIEFDEHLLYTWNDIKMVGLDNYLKDPTFNPNQNPLPQKNFFDGTYGRNTFTTTYNPLYGGNNQYPNSNNYPNNNNNNNYPNNNNNQYPSNNNNNQYPDYGGSNQFQQPTRSNYQTCGSVYNVCRMTFFVPNGTATYNYAISGFGREIMRDVPRYRWVMRRMIIHQEIYLEQLQASGQQYRYKADNGDDIVIKKESENVARVYWGNSAARVIMWDLGASNGVVHIIDNVISEDSDRYADISAASYLSTSFGVTGLILFVLVHLLTFREL